MTLYNWLADPPMTMLDGAPDCGVRRAAVAGGEGRGLAGGAPQDGAPQAEAGGQG